MLAFINFLLVLATITGVYFILLEIKLFRGNLGVAKRNKIRKQRAKLVSFILGLLIVQTLIYLSFRGFDLTQKTLSPNETSKVVVISLLTYPVMFILYMMYKQNVVGNKKQRRHESERYVR